MRGALFENWAIGELLKGRLNRGKNSNLHFWRDHLGLEVDVLAESGARLLPVEIKAGATLADDWFKGLDRWTELAGRHAGRGCLIYGGDDAWTRHGVEVVPWRAIADVATRL